MVTIRIWDNGAVLGFRCEGHANYAPKGQPDIVCAGISALTETLAAALSRFPEYDTKAYSGYAWAKCRKSLEARVIWTRSPSASMDCGRHIPTIWDRGHSKSV